MTPPTSGPILMSGAWYDLSPPDYARGLTFRAEQAEKSAEWKDREGRPWSIDDAAYYRRQACRLRAMALLCKCTTALCAGDVDFLGMTEPAQSREAESAAIESAHSFVNPHPVNIDQFETRKDAQR